MTIHPFDQLMELDAADIRLDCAALHLARDAYPDLEMRLWLDQLDEMARQAARIRPGLAATLRYRALREVLVEDRGLNGNADDYHDPDNSYLNRVLERRRGIPISLAVVWIEVARRLKWPVSGVGFPGHFLVRVDDPERFVIVDPFSDGRSLSINDCRALLERVGAGGTEFSPDLLEPVDTRQTLARLLTNLRGVYLARGELDRLESVLERLTAVEPTRARHARELAELYLRRGETTRAAEVIARFLRANPDSRARREVLGDLRRLASVSAALN